MARYGLTSANFRNISAKNTKSAGTYNDEDWDVFLIYLTELHGFEISAEALLLDIFILLLENGGTDKVQGLNGTTLISNDGIGSKWISWVTFKDQATSFWKRRNTQFTFRRFIKTFDELFYTLWQDGEITALDNIRQNGTDRSRQWTFPNGEAVPAYVVVPHLFDRHLSEEERAVRKIYNASIKLGQNEDGDVEYTGLDENGAVEDAITAARMKRQARLWAGAGGRSGYGNSLGLARHMGPNTGDYHAYLASLQKEYPFTRG